MASRDHARIITRAAGAGAPRPGVSSGRLIGVAVLESVTMIREAVDAAVLGEPSLHLIASSATLRQATHGVPWHQVGLLVTDLALPSGSGVDLAHRVRQSFPEMRVLVLTSTRRRGFFESLDASEREYWSYLLTSSVESSGQLGRILAKAARGQHLDPRLAARETAAEVAVDGLSDQQREALELLAAGHSNSAIAASMHLSEKSVEYHLKQIYKALDLLADTAVNSRVRAAMLYRQVSGDLRQ